MWVRVLACGTPVGCTCISRETPMTMSAREWPAARSFCGIRVVRASSTMKPSSWATPACTARRAGICVLGRTGVNFGAGFTGGFAYVLDLERDFVDRYNHELIDISRIHAESMQSHLQHLQNLLEEHVAETASSWAEEIVNDLRSYIGKFWVVKPKAASIDSLIENLRRAA